MLVARRQPVRDVWLGLSVAAAGCAAVASAGGIFAPSAYARETVLWAAQGKGQDIFNLVVVPLLIASAWLARRGSLRAALVWLGLLLYLIYSYVLYAFFVHFNSFFLVYVAALGFAVYAASGAAAECDADAWRWASAPARGERGLSALFMASALLFAALWLSQIVPALVGGATPPGLGDVGLVVNPVHVLDLAFVLPALATTAVLLWRRRPGGRLAAVPLAVFTMTMGGAIAGMGIAMSVRGVGSAGVVAPMSLLVATTLWLTLRLVRSMPAD